MSKVNNKDNSSTQLASFWRLLLTLNIIPTPFYSVSIVNFDQVKAYWDIYEQSRKDYCVMLIIQTRFNYGCKS